MSWAENQFAGFNIDPAFANCVDGLIVVDLARLKTRQVQERLHPRTARASGELIAQSENLLTDVSPRDTPAVSVYNVDLSQSGAGR